MQCVITQRGRGAAGGDSMTATASSGGAISSQSAAVIVQAFPALLRYQWTTLQTSGALAPPVPGTVFPNDTLPIPPNTPSRRRIAKTQARNPLR